MSYDYNATYIWRCSISSRCRHGWEWMTTTYTPDGIFCPSSQDAPSVPATHDTACLYNDAEATITWSTCRSRPNHHLCGHGLFEKKVNDHCALSASCRSLLVPSARFSTVGSRAGSCVWNTMSEETTSAPSLTVTRHFAVSGHSVVYPNPIRNPTTNPNPIPI